MDSLLFFIIILFSILVCMLIITFILSITYYNLRNRNSENINTTIMNTDTNIRNSNNDTLVEKTINSAYTDFRWNT